MADAGTGTVGVAAADAWSALSLLGLTPKHVAKLLKEGRGDAWQEPLRQHHHSRSVLQDVFVRLHGLLYDSELLPLSNFAAMDGAVYATIPRDARRFFPVHA